MIQNLTEHWESYTQRGMRTDMARPEPEYISIYPGMKLKHCFDLGTFILVQHGIDGDYTKAVFEKEAEPGHCQYAYPGRVYNWAEMRLP
jgi:hypothetical protein